MIAGIGMDIARVARMAEALHRRPQRLPRRLLTAEEQGEFARRGNCPRYLAARFAAKEALAKALGTGMRAPVLLSAVSVLNRPDGQPHFKMGGELAQFLADRGVGACHLSLSHDGEYAAAMVVAEKIPA